jgi:phosphocarrier protein|tara:strand:- start:494 stop:763 length:270 start_codon:yes stop_codon:yes gene_type:complete
MPTRKVEIVNRLGLHARAAAKFVQTAGHYGCDVLVARDGAPVNGKSIMAVMMLAASQGVTLEITTRGPEEDAALEALAGLVADRFGEDS